MPQMKVWVSTNIVGSKCSSDFEISQEILDDMLPNEVEGLALETMYDMIEWSFELEPQPRVWVATNLVGSKCVRPLGLSQDDLEDMAPNEIEEAALDCVFEMIDWGYEILP